MRVNADDQHGAIKIGDLLLTSPTTGFVTRSRPTHVGGQSLHRLGTLLGKALEALPSGKGEILVLRRCNRDKDGRHDQRLGQLAGIKIQVGPPHKTWTNAVTAGITVVSVVGHCRIPGNSPGS